MSFTHLHVHTEYSLLDGSGKIDEMVKRAGDLGMDSLAITDHGVMYGVIDFYRAARKAGIKPIIGCELYVTAGSRFDRDSSDREDRYNHLVLLAENNEGYSNLVKIVSLGFVDGFYYKPRVDYEVLEKYSGGLIALSACLAGIIPRNIIRGNYDKAKEEALRLKHIFGADNFFLELQDHGIPEQKMVNSQLLRMSEETGIGLVATNDIHYTYAEDAEAHDILLCIQTGKKVHDENRMRYEGGQYYIKSPREMEELFSYAPEAIENTGRIAERCNVEIEFGVQHLPKYDVPAPYTAEEYLEKLCEEGIRRRYKNWEDYEDRLRYELDTIKGMGYVDYFLIVWDFINFAKRNDIMVGPGRGSAAGSIVAYCLEITDIDPIKYSLIFERFLNKERVSMPDIDVDFCPERRGEVIEYVTEKYGRDHVAQIVTFGTMKARNVIRDVGRVLDMPYGAVDSIAKMVPKDLKITIDKALEESVELRTAYDSDPQIKQLLDMGRRLEGLPRHASMHAAGVVICGAPVMEFVPLSRGSDNSIVTQYVMTTLEELGLLKMDFLGLRNLTVIQNAERLIEKNSGVKIDFSGVDYNDKGVMDMIGTGRCDGVFQLESGGMKSFMRELKPKSLEDVIAGIALYRPGPMDFIPKYIEGKNNAASVKYDCPQLKPILENTYGCIVYQEQVMQIVRDLAGYTMGGSDILRRAMSKKKESVMIAERKKFVYGSEEENIAGCIKNGISEDIANKIYDEMMDFAKYAFNKSHAAAYAVVTFQTAYLKYYYPVEFMAALMSSVVDNTTKLARYTQECKDMGISMLPPDINKADSVFSAEGKNIRYGLTAIKGVGFTVIDQIIAERNENGAFKDIYDFARRMCTGGVNKKAVEGFIKAGSFDSFGMTRKQLIYIYQDVIDEETSNKKNSISGQISFFDMASAGGSTDSGFRKQPPNVGEFDRETLLSYEREITGIYISGHPLDDYDDVIRRNVTAYASDFSIDDEGEVKVKDGSTVIVGGVISAVRTKVDKKGQTMAFVTLEDRLGAIDVIIFARTYAECRRLVYEGSKVLIMGRASVDADDTGKLMCNSMRRFDSVNREVWLRFKNREEYSSKEQDLLELLADDNLRGDARLVIFLSDERQNKMLSEAYNISSGPEVVNIFKEKYGAENVAKQAGRAFTKQISGYGGK